MTIFKHCTIGQYIKYYRTRDDERGKSSGGEGKLVRPQDEGHDKAGRSNTQPHRQIKTRRSVRRDKVERSLGHRPTDAIRRAGEKHSHTEKQKHDGRYGGTM